MECRVSKQDKKGVWSSFLKDFLKIFKYADFCFDIFEKGQIFSPFQHPQNWFYFFLINVYIEESFDTIFNLGYGGAREEEA